MDSSSNNGDVAFEFPSVFRIYKDGRIDRFQGDDRVPPSTHPETGVQSKDVLISPENDISVRLFLPKITNPGKKLPLLFYIHGGAFCIGSPFSPGYTAFLNAVVAEGHVIGASIHYRRAPEHPLPVAFEDTWAALKWVATHADGEGQEPWLKDHADFGKVFLAGDSAGATLAQYAAVRAGVENPLGLTISGLILVHSYFIDQNRDKLMEIIFPTSKGSEDPRLNPAADPDLKKTSSNRVLVFVAEKDFLRGRGVSYCEALKKSGWNGEVEMVETEGEGHCFHLFNQNCEKAVELRKRFASFMKQS